jgi:tRNA (cmo5U34)-methyltransferase
MSAEIDRWSETESETYRALSDVAVPERERQIGIIAALVAASKAEGDVLDLCCGEGLLTRALLEALPEARLLAFDGSPSMLKATLKACLDDPRLTTRLTDIADHGWRQFDRPLSAVVSSLSVHHLDDAAKKRLFADLFSALRPGGVFVLADVIRPATAIGHEIAARQWDEEVERRSLEMRGDRSGVEAFRNADWNHFRHEKLDPIDKPSLLVEHVDWLRAAGFADVDLHWMVAGQMIVSGWKH